MRLASPPASMCLVPSPWQVEQKLLMSGFLSLCDQRACGLPANFAASSVWQSLQTGGASALASDLAGADGVSPFDGAGVGAAGVSGPGVDSALGCGVGVA